MTIIVHMTVEWRGPADARGDTRTYPKGWTGEMDDDAAGYCIARGLGRAVEPVPEKLESGIALLREIMAALEAERIEATYAAVYQAVARLQAEMSANHAASAAAAAAGAQAQTPRRARRVVTP